MVKTENGKPSMRQTVLMRAMADYHERRGYWPGLRELSNALGGTSTSVVAYHLGRLEGRGYIERDPGIARSTRLTDDGWTWVRDSRPGDA